ncbi:MAG: hypothetical protein H7318_17360 [Oligoflexus sp.]|nr:hypothetical protein [Oligoflexus sp.]
MNRARQGKVQYVDLEEMAMSLLADELMEFVAISTSMAKSFGFLQSRLKSEFPKDCRKCGKTYKTFEEFYFGTDEIVHGTVNYPTLGAEFYLHRNCKSPCESTLVVVFTDRRDDSPPGCKRRDIFESCLDKLQEKMPIQPTAAREFLLGLLIKKIHLLQKEKPKESVTLLAKPKPG